jgi:ATP-binding cassette, subfamily B, bacterial MsbA
MLLTLPAQLCQAIFGAPYDCSKMPKISVYIIAFNEVEKVGRAIKSVQWADEIVIVDSWSTDGTTELAVQSGARVVQVVFTGFGDLRNQAIAACTHEWIFSLDSDEYCTPEAASEIKSIIQNNDSLDVYRTPRMNYFMGKWIRHSGWYPNYRQPQLFRNGSMHYDNKPVHEGFIVTSKKPIGYMQNPIWQFPFKNMSEVISKMNRYSTLGVQKVTHREVTMNTAFLHAIWAFIKHLIFKRGIFDGWAGFVIALGSFEVTFYRYVKAVGPSTMKPTSQASNREIYFRLLTYLKDYRKIFAVAVICMAATAATEPVFPAMMKYLVDNGFKTKNAVQNWAIPLGIVALFIFRSIFVFVTAYLMAWITSKLIADMRNQMFEKLQTLPARSFEHESAGQFVTRMLIDVANTAEAATSALVSLVRESLTAIALIGYLLYLDWLLTVFVLGSMPAIGLIVARFGKRVRAASQRSMMSMRTVSHTIEESVMAHKVIKIFGGQDQLTKRFINNSEHLRRSQMKEAVPLSATTPVSHVVVSISIALIVYIALNQVSGEASASAGGFISFITAMLLLIAPIKQLTNVSNIIQRGLAAAQSVFDFLDTPGEVDKGTISMGRAKGKIEFKGINFQYPGTDRLVLNNINLLIEPGQMIALVGGSGGGKSTLCALISRFYQPVAGRIELDGIDISEVSLASLRENIALVSQDIILFNDTISANIAFGSLNTTSDAEIRKAAEAAYALEFIHALPMGFQTVVGENGVTLSGGQKQRIAIARALLKNAPILILDEATSALDTESERNVQAALENLMSKQTTIVIAHRLSTIQNADCILVMGDGKVVESGTHNELLKLNGHYARLMSQ